MNGSDMQLNLVEFLKRVLYFEIILIFCSLHPNGRKSIKVRRELKEIKPAIS